MLGHLGAETRHTASTNYSTREEEGHQADRTARASVTARGGHRPTVHAVGTTPDGYEAHTARQEPPRAVVISRRALQTSDHRWRSSAKE